MIELVTKSLQDHFREQLRKQGFKEVKPGTFELIVDDTRVTWRRTQDGWRQTIDMLVGVKIIDDPEGLLP